MTHLPSITPQGKLLIYKGITGLLSGALLFYLYPRHLNGFQAFFLSAVIYAVISIVTSEIAKKASPAISLGLYIIIKGLMTYYFSLYLSLLTLHIITAS